MADAKKYVFKVDVHDEIDKSKAMKAVAGFHGIDSLSVDIKDKKMTLIGIVDPVEVVRKLRKRWPHVGILTVGPAKEPEKKPETDKAGDKDKGTVDPIAEWIKLSQANNPHMIMHHWIPTAEENPNACLIM